MNRYAHDSFWFAVGSFIGIVGGSLVLVFFILLTGCVKHEVRAPQIDEAISAITKQCPELPPIPQDVVIDIKGDKVTANTGGELLLRSYVRARGAH